MNRGIYVRTLEIREKNKKSSLGHVTSDETKKKLSEISKKLGLKPPTPLKGFPRSKEVRQKISQSNKGQIPWIKGKHHSPESILKMSEVKIGKKFGPMSEEHKKKIGNSVRGKLKGSKNPMWKGGITPENIRIRQSTNGHDWRRGVFTRDNYTCQKYRIKGGNLVAHHINNFADFPELRFAIDNGITLSETAHREFHKKYGKRNNTKEQLEEFLNNQ